MKKHGDSRVNANNMNIRAYIQMFVFILSICGTNYAIYWKFTSEHMGKIYMYLSMLGYVLTISIIILVLVDLYRKYFFMKPVYSISEAARKVAEGDYSVHLKSIRKDGKKDEFEVLFDDFNRMVEELQSTELMKNDFVSNVSHELKTPLAVINNYAMILQDSTLQESQRAEYSKKIAEASVRMSVLVTNILQLNRLEHQKITPVKKKYNLSEQLSRCIIGFDQILEEKNINLETKLDENVILAADESLLDIAWNNLISNAIKFTEYNGTINIDIECEGNESIVKIRDYGCGINEKDIKHIFDKFFQADVSRGTSGNGLGLSMVKKIVELFDGKIQVKSKVGEGTEFLVIFHLNTPLTID